MKDRLRFARSGKTIGSKSRIREDILLGDEERLPRATDNNLETES